MINKVLGSRRLRKLVPWGKGNQRLEESFSSSFGLGGGEKGLLDEGLKRWLFE